MKQCWHPLLGKPRCVLFRRVQKMHSKGIATATNRQMYRFLSPGENEDTCVLLREHIDRAPQHRRFFLLWRQDSQKGNKWVIEFHCVNKQRNLITHLLPFCHVKICKKGRNTKCVFFIVYKHRHNIGCMSLQIIWIQRIFFFTLNGCN